MSMPEKRAMIGRGDDKFSISLQCGLLEVSRFHLCTISPRDLLKRIWC